MDAKKPKSSILYFFLTFGIVLIALTNAALADNLWENQHIEPKYLLSVHEVVPNVMYGIGNYGRIVRMRVNKSGINWIKMESGTSKDLKDVWGNSENDIYAVGLSGTILRYDGTSWSPMSAGTSSYYGVWGSSANNVYAVGSGGVLFITTAQTGHP